MTITAVASDDDEPRKDKLIRLTAAMQNAMNVIEQLPPVLEPVVAMLAETAAFLVAGHLSILYRADQEEGCCPECCAPCAGLKQLLDVGQLDDIARPYYEKEGSSDIWVNGQVDREFLKRAWRMTDCHGWMVDD
jgi:hypothetical protein